MAVSIFCFSRSAVHVAVQKVCSSFFPKVSIIPVLTFSMMCFGIEAESSFGIPEIVNTFRFCDATGHEKRKRW